MREKIEEKLEAGERLSHEEGVFLIREADLLWLGRLADEVRRRKHPARIVTYVVDRNINYTNICVSSCAFCAFHRKPGSAEGYVLSRQELARKIEETLAVGGTQMLMQGGLNPELGLEWFLDLFGWIKANFTIHIHALSPPEVVHIAHLSGLAVSEVLGRLQRAGLDSIPGGGAEILVEGVRRRVSPRKCTADEWLEVMERAHGLGIPTTATMMFGHIERPEDRVTHMTRLRALQDRTGGFTAFIPWTYQPDHTALGGKHSTAVAYLRTLAASRLILDNIENIQVSWVTQGAKVAQVALQFGANDFGSTMLEENVVSAAGATHRMSRDEIVRSIEEAGYTARQRDMRYRLLS